MTTIRIEVDPVQLAAVRASMEVMPRASQIALTHAINRVIGGPRGGIKKVIANAIYSAVHIPKSFIYKQTGHRNERTFYDKKATLTTLSGWVSTRGANVPLIYYTNQARNLTRHPKSIYVTVQRSRGRTKLEHAFIPQLKSGHRGVFVRRNPDDPKDRRIRQLWGSRLPDVLSNQETITEVEKAADKILYKNLDHELTFMIRKAFTG